MRRLIIPSFLVFALACGGDSGTGPATYESIAGTYVGAIAGTTQGIDLQANFTLTITQSGGTLGGSYSLTGTLSDGVNTVSLAGGGTIAGQIAAGNNPSVNITAKSGICPNIVTSLSGSYDSVNRIVTLTGNIPVFDVGTCQVVLTYANSVLILRR